MRFLLMCEGQRVLQGLIKVRQRQLFSDAYTQKIGPKLAPVIHLALAHAHLGRSHRVDIATNDMRTSLSLRNGQLDPLIVV